MSDQISSAMPGRLVSAPSGVHLLTDDGREVHVGEEVPAGVHFFRVVGPSAPTGITVLEEQNNGQ